VKLPEISHALLIIACLAAPIAARGEAPPDTCTCMTTIVGDGDHKERHCDGFNPATHARCACEQKKFGDEVACVPKNAAGTANAEPRRDGMPH
jgi:hypothetical protein